MRSAKNKQSISIHWFRRDLRLDDNTALFHALNSGSPVVCVFIFDTQILNQLENKSDARVLFIYEQILRLKNELQNLGSDLDVRYGNPFNVWKDLIEEYTISNFFFNHDYEPYARKRDAEIIEFLKMNHISCSTFKDQVIFEKDEIVKSDLSPYTIYTPYSRRWKDLLLQKGILLFDCKTHFNNFYQQRIKTLPKLEEMGFMKSNITFPVNNINEKIISNYSNDRDIPGIHGTSRLGIHLRFGTVSIRDLISKAQSLSESWLNELCWREFYMMILWHFPHVVDQSFKAAYDYIPWRNNESEFKRWCKGTTGYPIVDAGMRELNETGFMHNRVRMITASFLTKHLLIDWRWGEAYFAEKLLDFELSSNNGGWQWAAGCGCDAAPYFRIFNPYLQTQRFDPDFKYIRKWVPEFEDFGYPPPIVEHKFARERCLTVYKQSLVVSR